MSSPFNPPVKGENFQILIALKSVANGDYFKLNPPINAGDFKVLTWNESPGSPTPTEVNLATTPQAIGPQIGTQSIWVLLSLSASEMNGDTIGIAGRQAGSPQEWADFALSIPTTSA